MKSEIQKIVIEEFRGETLRFSLLFGSMATDKTHDFSDIDIGICTGAPMTLESLGYHTAMLETKLGKKVDLIDLYRLYEKDPLLAFEIYSRHLPIEIRDEKAYIRFKTKAQLYYLDHLPLIEANRRQLDRRIEEGKIGERNYA